MERSAAEIDRHVARMMQTCREAGLNVTAQRITIYRRLVESSDHPTPEALFQRVRDDLPSLSLATVYKVLDALVSVDLVRAVRAGGGTRFDANLEKHHHLVCTECDAVTDFYDEDLDDVRPPRRVAGFVAEDVQVQVLGVCAACRKKRR